LEVPPALSSTDSPGQKAVSVLAVAVTVGVGSAFTAVLEEVSEHPVELEVT
jgi:hypothetical protein